MSTRKRRGLLTILALVAGFVATGVPGAAKADELAMSGTSLPLQQWSYADSALDEAHGLVFVAGDVSDHSVVVLRPDGSLVTHIYLPDVISHLALASDGSFLYASLSRVHEIAQIDTTTWQVQEFATGDSDCPQNATPVGDGVYFTTGDSCGVGTKRLRRLDLGTGTVTDVFPGSSAGDFENPSVEAVPGHPMLLISDGATTSLIETDGDPTVMSTAAFGWNGRMPQFAGDGTSVVVGRETYSLPDLTDTGALPVPEGTIVDAADADTVVSKGRVYDRLTGSLLNTVRFGRNGTDTIYREFMDGDNLVALVSSLGVTTLYVVPDPRTAAPTITAHATEAVAMHPVTVSGTLADQDEPMAGATLHVTDDFGETFGDLITAADGSWSLEHTWTDYGPDQLYLRTDATPGHKSALLIFGLDVAAPTITVSAPDTVSPHATVEVTGSLTALGDPVPDSPVDWAFYCMDYPDSLPWDSGRVTTASDGSFAVTVDPALCVHARIAFSWGGHTYRPGRNDAHVDVTVPWKTSQMTVDLPDSGVYIGDHVHAVATYTVDGQPVAGVPVRVYIMEPGFSGISDVTETTDAQGQVPVDFDTEHRGNYGASISAAATSDTLPSGAIDYVASQDVATVIGLSTSAYTVTAGAPVTISGTISRTHGPIAGIPLHLKAEDYFGRTPRTYDTTTDDQGHYTFTDTPPITPYTRYVVTFDGDGELYPPSSSDWKAVSVDPQHPTLTLSSDRESYDAGAIAHLHLSLAQTVTRRVVLTAYPAPATPGNGPGSVLFDGQVPDEGLTIDYATSTNTTLTAVAPNDGSQLEADAALVLNVRMSMSAHALAPQSVSRTGVAVYSYAQQPHPRFAATAAPPRDVCERFVVQRQATSGWRALTRSACESASTRAVYRLAHSTIPGVMYRLRTEFAGDPRNLASHSPWVVFRFRRP